MRRLLSRYACFAFIAVCFWPAHGMAWTVVEPAPSDEQPIGRPHRRARLDPFRPAFTRSGTKFACCCSTALDHERPARSCPCIGMAKTGVSRSKARRQNKDYSTCTRQPAGSPRRFRIGMHHCSNQNYFSGRPVRLQNSKCPFFGGVRVDAVYDHLGAHLRRRRQEYRL